MKNLVFIIFATFFPLYLFSQTIQIDKIISKKDNFENYYDLKILGSKVLYLPMDYGKFKFTLNQIILLEELRDAKIVKVDLAYTDFPKATDFSVLTKKRFESLFNLLPSLLLDTNIVYNKIRQTGAKNLSSAKMYPHGFYIYYRPNAKIGLVKKEFKKLKELLPIDSGASTKPAKSTSKISYCSIWSFYADTGLYVHPLDSGFIRTIKKIGKKQAIKDDLLTKEYFEALKDVDSVYYVLDINEEGCDFIDGSYTYESCDTTVSAVFDRNKGWKTDLIVCDVTGSMYPYIAQLLIWVKLKQTDNKKRNYVFFNDGDAKKDSDKKIGSTGGIYPISSANYDSVLKTIETAMINGCGGDAPENNLEAIISSQKLINEKDTIIMIADNWASIKDYKLVSKIKNPIKIILCGVYGSINTDYLNLARETKGSVHLIETDIYNLAILKEGETIKIGDNSYRIVDGLFKEIIKTKL